VQTETLGQVVEGLDFEEFFHSHYPGLVRALYLLTASQDEAEELAQETMVRLYARWDRVRMMESPAGYAYRVAVNLNRQRLRRLGVRARRLFALRPSLEQEESPGARMELSEAIAALSTGQREAFMFVEWVGLSAEEAGQILRITPGSVRARVHRARAALRDRLREDGDNDD
jgi:RNA polymerase sigma-70 factor (ECF subfamily)